jgi:hypothetical protein
MFFLDTASQHEALKNLFDAIRELLKPEPPSQPPRPIGFHAKEQARQYRISTPL